VKEKINHKEHKEITQRTQRNSIDEARIANPRQQHETTNDQQ
jgi:hypothetical protein